MPAYTPNHGFPYPVSADRIAATDENLRLAFKSLADKSEQKHSEALDVYDALLGTNPIRVRGSLPADQDLDAMTSPSWNGLWTVGSANTNPGLPARPGVAAKLTVNNTANDNFMRVDFRSGGGSFERVGSGSTWASFYRVDSPLAYNGTLPDGTDFNELRTRKWNGIWTISSTATYLNRPENTGVDRQAGMIVVHTSGLGDTTHHVVYRFRSGEFTRQQTGSATFSEWLSPGASAAEVDLDMLEARVALLEAAQEQPETTFENTNIFTTYHEGEAFMDVLARKNPDKVTILDLGDSRQGRPIRAFQLGDPAKPTYYVIAAQHGSEPMGREAAYLWVRELCQDDSPETMAFLKNACVVVTPVVNADKINVQRLSSSNTDLNRNWITKTTTEIQAASSVFTTHNVVLTLDAHEGGKWDAMQADIPSAPEVAPSLVTVSQSLFDSVAAQYVTENENFERYLGDTTLEIARNAVPVQYKSATILFEGASGLDANMYAPDVAWRRKVYLIAYRSVFAYVRSHLSDFVAAKNSAS